MIPNKDHKINLFQRTNKTFVDPPPQPIMAKADTGATSHYFHQSGANVIVKFQPKTNWYPS